MSYEKLIQWVGELSKRVYDLEQRIAKPVPRDIKPSPVKTKK